MTASVRAWLFDVDGCLVDSMTGRSLRPGAAALLKSVRAAGHPVVLWSAGGAEHAREVAERTGIDPLVDAYYDKDWRGHDRRWLVHHLDVAHRPAVCIDDRPDEVPAGVECIAVFPYITRNDRDNGLRQALDRLRSGLAAEDGCAQS